MSEKRIALVDVDGVLEDCCGALSEYLAERGITYSERHQTTYDFRGNIGCPRSAVFQAMKEEPFWNYRKPIEGGRQALDVLRQAGFEPWYYTLGSGCESQVKRLEYLKDFYGFTDGLYCEDVASGKPVIPASVVLFEDHPQCIQQYLDSRYSGALYMIRHHYNETCFVDDDKVKVCGCLLGAATDFVNGL